MTGLRAGHTQGCMKMYGAKVCRCKHPSRVCKVLLEDSPGVNTPDLLLGR